MFENFSALNNPMATNMGGGIPSATAISTTTPMASGMGLDPRAAMFASILGQMGSAISPEGSWGSRLGAVAGNMGSQKLQQMAAQAAEKRQMEFYKKLFEKTNNPFETQRTLDGVNSASTTPIGMPDIKDATPGSMPTPVSGFMNENPMSSPMRTGVNKYVNQFN